MSHVPVPAAPSAVASTDSRYRIDKFIVPAAALSALPDCELAAFMQALGVRSELGGYRRAEGFG